MKNLYQYYLFQLKKNPNKIFCADSSHTYSFNEVGELLYNLKLRLDKFKLKKKSIISVVIDNSLEYLLVFLFCLKENYIFNPYPHNMTKNDISRYIERLPCKLLISNQKFKNLKKKSYFEINKNNLNFPLNANQKSFYLNNFFRPNIEDTFSLYYSSGTTANPKIIEYSFHNLIALSKSITSSFKFSNQSRHMIVLPLGHTASLNYSLVPMIKSGGFIYFENRNFDFVSRNVFKIIKKFKINYIQLVPSLLTSILYLSKKTNSNLKLIGCGSSKLSISVKEKFEKKFSTKVINLYGLSETGPTHYIYNKSSKEKDTLGKPLQGVKHKILIDNKFYDVDTKIGEICINSKNVFKNYYKNKKLYKKSFFKSFFKTGDLGYIDKNGNLNYTGRKKELIIKNGINILPDEIDEILEKHKDVRSSLSISSENILSGEIIKSYIVSNKKVSEKSIIKHCNKYLSAHKIPDQIIFVDSLPKTPSGKFSRKLLNEKFK